MRARLRARLVLVLAAVFWLQASSPIGGVTSPRRPQAPRPHREPDPRELVRRRVLYLYHQADQSARDALWRAGWPAYT